MRATRFSSFGKLFYARLQNSSTKAQYQYDENVGKKHDYIGSLLRKKPEYMYKRIKDIVLKTKSVSKKLDDERIYGSFHSLFGFLKSKTKNGAENKKRTYKSSGN